jgi:hypothetical protein
MHRRFGHDQNVARVIVPVVCRLAANVTTSSTGAVTV